MAGFVTSYLKGGGAAAIQRLWESQEILQQL